MEAYALKMTLGVDQKTAEELIRGYLDGFPQLKEGNQEKFLNIVSGQSNTSRKTSDRKVPKTKPSPGKETLDISKETKKSALERLLEKFR